MNKQEAIVALCQHYQKFRSIPRISQLTDRKFIVVAEMCLLAVQQEGEPVSDEDVRNVLAQERASGSSRHVEEVQSLRDEIVQEKLHPVKTFIRKRLGLDR